MTDKVLWVDKSNDLIAYDFFGDNSVLYFGDSCVVADTLKMMVYIMRTDSDMLRRIMADGNICKYIVSPISSLKKYDFPEIRNCKIAGSLIKENNPDSLHDYREKLVGIDEKIREHLGGKISEMTPDDYDAQRSLYGAKL